MDARGARLTDGGDGDGGDVGASAPPVRRNAYASSSTAMNGGFPRGKRGRNATATAGPDFLSALPEGILHHIMSFLNVRQVIQTCVLSWRWRDLWRSVPRINANYCELSMSPIAAFTPDNEAAFKRFVNRLLERRDPAAVIHTFNLRYTISNPNNRDNDSADANRWISHALQNQASFLKIIVDAHELHLDHTVFTSCYLGRITLKNVFLDQGFFEQLEIGCPLLQDLLLYDCIIGDDEISSETLNVLTMYGCQFPTLQESCISAPNLTSLIMHQPENFVPVLDDVASLVTATVDLFPLIEFCAYDMRQLLWSLSGVRNLDLDYYACKSSPKLEKLTLKLEKYYPHPYEHIIGDELTERSFTCEHLKIVEIICMEDDEPLAKIVEGLFVDNGMNSVRFNTG
nr:F-box/FBD/LRR-repeat protein At1g78750 [Oryza sativa Japonica Group]